MDDIVKQDVQALVLKPLEWLAKADEIFTASMQRLSAAIIQDCDEVETAKIHAWTKKVSNDMKAFQDNARNRLMTFILAKGRVATEAGTLEIDIGDGYVQRAIPTNTKPSDRLVEQLLRAKGLSLDEYMYKEVKYVIDTQKLKKLLDDEDITQKEYKSCFEEVSYRVMPIQKGADND